MITIEEMLNLVVYFFIISMLVGSVYTFVSASNDYKHTIISFNKALELELQFNTYINDYRVKGNKWISAGGILVQGKNGKVKLNDEYITLLVADGNYEPY